MSNVEQLNFLSSQEVNMVAQQWGTPVFVYDEAILQRQADAALAFGAPFGLGVRYAMKANPNRHILRTFNEKGIAIDASSGFEAERAMLAGIEGAEILLTSQELPKDLGSLVERGVQFNACSLHQLREYGRQFPGSTVGVRINPGLGSGHSSKTNVGGPSSSFGIWHEYVDDVLAIAKEYKLTVDRLHTHIGSGSDPDVWTRVASMSLEQAKVFPDVTTLDLGGGFKVPRMRDEIGTDLKKISPVISEALERFYRETGRRLKLEIEPGTFLVANAGSLVTTIQDIVDTGEGGHTFLKIDSGMTEVMRPSLYGAQHPLVVVNGRGEEHQKYVVVGHCCESGDLLTPQPGDPEAIGDRLLKKAEIGDLLVVEGVGAYCAYMSAQNYNSFPLRPEVMRKAGGSLVEICRRETLKEMLHLETK
ncbi:MAG TPA: diaminopimelate decarboxylase [Candidatus Saccharibacteria bacterium]|nr:diaminopimelate decarboxylase [Candidatus Saccharibacteria bacterium]